MPAKGFRAAVGSTNTSGACTLQSIQCGTSGRAWIRGLGVGVTTGAPGDVESRLYVDRITAAGTASGVGSTSIAPDDLADLGTEKANVNKENTAEPTYSSRPFYNEIFNHRVKEQIYLPQGDEWVLPAVASAGMGMRVNSTVATISLSYISWKE